MNFFNVYIEGLSLMYARMETGMAINEGLLYPIHETAFEIMSTVPLEDGIFIFNSQ